MSLYIALTEHTGPFHILYSDVKRICQGDTVSANALRAFEVRAGYRAGSLIERFGIQPGYAPHPDDMWFEMPLRDVEDITIGAESKSTYARVLTEVNLEESAEESAPALIQLGFVERRFIARPASDLEAAPAALTAIYRDEDDKIFIVVDKPDGRYHGYDGVEHNARLEGYSRVIWQYRYCDEAINAALARSAWREPPDPLPRWRPLHRQRKGGVSAQEMTAPTDSAAGQNSTHCANAQEGTWNAEAMYLFTNENNTSAPDVSMQDAVSAQRSRRNSQVFPQISQENAGNSRVQFRTGVSSFGRGCPAWGAGGQNRTAPSETGRNKKEKNPDSNRRITQKESAHSALSSCPLYASLLDFEQVRYAEWTPETLIALSSALLPIPDPASVDSQSWQRDYLEPARWLIAALDGIDPVRAWEKVERHIRGMLAGPTWYATKRSRLSPITLRHVVGTNKQTGELNGGNWRVVDAELEKAAWYPSETTPYDGPIGRYADGYSGERDHVVGVDDMVVEEASAPSRAEPHTDELPIVTPPDVPADEDDEAIIEVAPVQPAAYDMPLYAMQPDEAQAVADAMLARYPTLLLFLREYDDGSVEVLVDYAPDRQFEIRRASIWYSAPPAVERRVEQAARYGAQLVQSQVQAALIERGTS